MALVLAAAEQGAGPPLVILHGLFGSATNWATVARRLAATHRVAALDLRNHGRSPWSDEVGYDAQAEDLAAFIRSRGWAAASLLGHSMGGKAAMVLALREPRLVARLVVCDVAPVAYPPTLGRYAEAMRAIDPRRISRRAEADALLRAMIPEEAIRAFLLQNLVAGPDGLHWRLNLDAIVAGIGIISGFPDLPAEAVYGGPTLFIRGGRSDYVRDEHRAVILRRFPRAAIVTVEGAGHWVHAEQPATFLDRVERFLAA
jgi:pimeloyl-ACP methyl ester carboxylesterase